MKQLNILSNALTAFGMILMAIFSLSRDSWNWPEAIAGNMNYISYGSVTLGVILKLIYFIVSREKRNARNFALFILLYAAVFFILYKITK